VPSYPDPDSDGQLPKGDAQHFGVSSSTLTGARAACRRLLPATGQSFQQATGQCLEANDCSPALTQQILTVQRRYSRCIRSHGYRNWPDPTLDAQGRPYFDVSGAGISSAETHSSAFLRADGVCERRVGVEGDVPVDMG
jgi:hypothetical protein